MSPIEVLNKALDSAFWELGEGFKGLPDEDVWRRPHPNLLSIGEIATHLAYWHVQSLAADVPHENPLVHAGGKYYTLNVGEPFSLPLGAEEVDHYLKEARRLTKAKVAELEVEMGSPSPYREGWTWGQVLEYQAFHVAYHAGQIYSVRHLFGHVTVDN